jgi:hypothetical protein
VDNVGVYTNASNPTNSGYGAWTNNYVSTNYLHLTEMDFGALAYWPLPVADVGVWTNVTLNAKDVRAMDCIFAFCERYQASGMYGGNISNYWEYAMPFTYPFDSYAVWRDEREIIQSLKDLIRPYDAETGKGNNLLSYFYYPIPTNSAPTNWVAHTETSLAAASGVPTNFFRYTPHRAADGSWTHYQRILTNTFVLCQGTNAAHVATNSLVDSAGIEFTAVGTNGLTVTRYATNVNQQAGTDLGAYGWDGMRRVISNLNITVSPVSWGIGEGTNWSDVAGTNLASSVTVPVDFGSGTPFSNVVSSEVTASAEASNPDLPYSAIGGTIAPDEWGWSFSLTSSPAIFTRTNMAPYSTATAMAGHDHDLRSLHRCYVYRDTFDGPWKYGSLTNWVYSTPNFGTSKINWYRTNNTQWINYGAPLVNASTFTNIARTVLSYAKTNGASILVASNYYDAGVSSRTSTAFRLPQPILTNFWFEYKSYVTYNGWSLTYPGSGLLGGDAYLYSSMVVTHTNYAGYNAGGVTISTNIATPTVTADKAVEIWDFEYK